MRGLLKIRKKHLTEKEQDYLRKDLTLINPEYQNKRRFSRFKSKDETGKYDLFYEEFEKYFLIPRNYYEDIQIERKNVPECKQITLKADFKLRRYQRHFLYKNAGLDRDCVWNLPCGHGKTVLAVWKGVQMQTKFLVVVPTHFLERQWKKRIKAMTDGAFIHCISTKKDIPYNSNNVFIVTIETLKLLDYKKRMELSEHIGIVFFDEAHRMGATTYHPVLNDLQVPYFQALTATFRRGDGRERILTYHFGDIYRMKNKLPKAIVQPYYTGIDCERIIKYKSVPDFFRKDIEKMKDDDLFNVPEYLYNKWNKYVGKNRSEKMRLSNFKKLMDRPLIGNVDTFISRHFRKHAQIKKLITACLENGRKPLILGKRLQGLKVLHKYFLKLGYKSVLVIGNTKVKDDDEQDKLLQEAELIFGIDALAKEGLDVDNVDTLITFRAMPDPEQPIGRIQRLHKDKKYPLVLYPIDGSNYYKYMFTGSKKYMVENSVVREPVRFLKVLRMVKDATEFTQLT